MQAQESSYARRVHEWQEIISNSLEGVLAGMHSRTLEALPLATDGRIHSNRRLLAEAAAMRDEAVRAKDSLDSSRMEAQAALFQAQQQESDCQALTERVRYASQVVADHGFSPALRSRHGLRLQGSGRRKREALF